MKKPGITHKLMALPSLLMMALSLVVAFSPFSQAQEMEAVDYETQSIQLSLATEPPNLNYTKATDAISFFILEHTQEGLLRKDARNQLTAGIAEQWELTDTTATFRIREDAIWSDGTPITAHDFVFGWRTVVDPATASEYAAIMYPIKNAEAINTGQAPVEALGVEAMDDRTLFVELEQPTGYFLQLMPFALFYPVKEEFYLAQNGRFSADVENMLFSGPFLLTQWVHGARLRLEKNPAWWNSEIVEINTINIPYITPDAQAVFNLYKDGKLAMVGEQSGLGSETLQGALDERMRIRSASDGAVFYQEFNHREGHVTSNLNFRKAIQAIYDPQELVYKVMGVPGYIPGESLFPTYLQGVDDKFRVEYTAPKVDLNAEKAREYLELARQELGIEEFPTLTLLIGDGASSMLMAQYLQSHYKRLLGLEFKIDAQIFKQRLAKMLAGDFDIVMAGWGPDYSDPMTFADLFASWNINNRGRFADDELDRQVRIAQNSTDPQTRMDAMGEVQRILVEQAAILVDYERVISYVQNKQLEGVSFKVTGGSPIFTYARILPTDESGD